MYNNRYEGYNPLVRYYEGDMLHSLQELKPNNFQLMEPNSNCIEIIRQFDKSGKTNEQILAILNMMGISYNLAYNNLFYYRMENGKITPEGVRNYYSNYYYCRTIPHKIM